MRRKKGERREKREEGKRGRRGKEGRERKVWENMVGVEERDRRREKKREGERGEREGEEKGRERREGGRGERERREKIKEKMQKKGYKGEERRGQLTKGLIVSPWYTLTSMSLRKDSLCVCMYEAQAAEKVNTSLKQDHTGVQSAPTLANMDE